LVQENQGWGEVYWVPLGLSKNLESRIDAGNKNSKKAEKKKMA